MGLRRCRNFMQGSAHEPAAKHRVDRGNAKGQHAGAVLDLWRPLQGLQTLAKLCDHHEANPKPLKMRTHSAQSGWAVWYLCSWFVLM